MFTRRCSHLACVIYRQTLFCLLFCLNASVGSAFTRAELARRTTCDTTSAPEPHCGALYPSNSTEDGRTAPPVQRGALRAKLAGH